MSKEHSRERDLPISINVGKWRGIPGTLLRSRDGSDLDVPERRIWFVFLGESGPDLIDDSHLLRAQLSVNLAVADGQLSKVAGEV